MKSVLKKLPEGWFLEATFHEVAPKILTTGEVISVVASLRKKYFSETVILLKAKDPAKRIYGYSLDFAALATDALRARAKEIEPLLFKEKDYYPINQVAKKFKTTKKVIEDVIIDYQLGLDTPLIKREKPYWLIHQNVLFNISALLVPSEDLETAHTGRRIMPKPTLDQLDQNFN